MLDAAAPVRSVVHAAGVLDDGLLATLDSERLARVLAPKVDGALHLHELTAGLDLEEFVVFSSVAGTLGSAGQANYAAANAFLDALAAYRRAQGLPGLSLAWGPWESGMAGTLDEAGRGRLARAGMQALSAEDGVALFDLAREAGAGLLVPVVFDTAGLRAQARAGALVPVLSGLVRASARRAGQDGALARRLAEAPEGERDAIALELVLAHVAAVLGHDSAAAIDAGRPFKELGFDSLGSVELRNRLGQATGLKVPSTLIFDYPTPQAVAGYLREQLPENSGVAAALPATRGGTLGEMLRNARGRGMLEDAVTFLVGASRMWPTFARGEDLPQPPRVFEMANGPESPALICIPSFVNGLGPHQFLRIAGKLESQRAVSALALPGFGRGELLPESWAVTVDVLAEAVTGVAGDRPFALVGYSVGGALAHALTAKLEVTGRMPEGLVLLDSYSPYGDDVMLALSVVLDTVLAREDADMLIDDDHLVTMGAYFRFMQEWSPAPLRVRSLLVQAEEAIGGELHGERWNIADEVVRVPGDHFTMIETDAGTTAAAINGWLNASTGAPEAAAPEPIV